MWAVHKSILVRANSYADNRFEFDFREAKSESIDVRLGPATQRELHYVEEELVKGRYR
jgi:hypothetical protein